MLKDKIDKLFEDYWSHPLVREPVVGDTYKHTYTGQIFRYSRDEGDRVWLQWRDKKGNDAKLQKIGKRDFYDGVNLGDYELIDSEPILGKGVETSSQATQDARIAKMHAKRGNYAKR